MGCNGSTLTFYKGLMPDKSAWWSASQTTDKTWHITIALCILAKNRCVCECTRFFLVLGFCRFFSSAKGKTKKSANSNSHYIWRIVGKTLINELMLESITGGRIGCVVCFSPLIFLAKTSSRTITDRYSNSHKILLVTVFRLRRASMPL